MIRYMPFRIVQSLLLVSMSVNAGSQNPSNPKLDCYQPMIKPVRLSDVKIRLDDGEKLVDAVICLEERRL